MPFRVFLVDDHPLVGKGLAALFGGSDFSLVGQSLRSADAVKRIIEAEPNLVILDARLGDGDGLSVLARLKTDRPQLAAVLFSAYDNPALMARAVALGAAGFLLKTIQRESLLESLARVARGESLWSREEMRRASGALSIAAPKVDLEASLTKREDEVLMLLARGGTNKQIAESLQISYETVKEHVQHLLQKIGVTDRTQAAIWAVRARIV